MMGSMQRLAALLFLIAVAPGFTGSSPLLTDDVERVRAYTRAVEFDFVSWTLDAATLKLGQAALAAHHYLPEEEQSQLVWDYMSLIADIQNAEHQLRLLHANPDRAAVAAPIAELQGQLDDLYARRSVLSPLAEGILQSQVTALLAEQGLSSGGQPVPPLLYHSTPLPWALIVSPRASISQMANLSLETELTLEEHIQIEDAVAQGMDVSTLVVPVGGVGTYPTMVAQSSSLNWLSEVIAHEWLHNYLAWHPLGMNYSASGQLTTMNETTANIFGAEIGAAVIARYYPELVPPPPSPRSQPEEQPSAPPEPPAFDFREQMHITRLHVDALLAEGKVAEAEAYMEARRLVFWEHGYIIRKLNQAYFAFYGSYADSPIGPAGADPVGAAVRELRQRSSSLAEFVHHMQSLTTFEGLQDLLASLD